MKSKIRFLFSLFIIFFLTGCASEELAKKDSEIQALSKDKNEFASQAKDLAYQLQLKDQEIGFLKEKINANNQEIEALNLKLDKLSTIEKDFAVLQSEKKSGEELLNEKIKNLTDINTANEARLKEKDDSIQKLEEIVKKLTDDNLKLAMELEQKKQEIEKISQDVKAQETAFKASAPQLQNIQNLENKVQELEKSLAEKNKEIATLKEQVAELKKFQEEMEKNGEKIKEAFKNEIKKGEIIVEHSVKKIQVVMMEQVLFRKSEISLTPQGEKVLKKVAAILKDVSDKEIFIVGHADSDPVKDPIIKKIFPTNWEFSVMRAVMVVRYLTEILDLKPSTLTAAGCSYYKPIMPETSEKNKSVNRRTEILIFPKFDKVAKKEEK
ncbi:MAG: hypothetical protein A2Y41_14110 [Spirochaetes bacterium GWB1_36_13]|nr:MAG: hypothetical protein A2Y41_14110 [Spirochaetes bacterium GWB1_36_13]